MKVYSKINSIPSGRSGEEITPGCLVLEGGAWRGIYTQGALDALMSAGINFRTVVGVSAGAMASFGYLSGQIGWYPRINLTYRHDPAYCGWRALLRDHGITGFSYLYSELMTRHAFDWNRFMAPGRKLCVAATNCETGKTTYFDRDRCDIYQAARASATVPYLSEPVEIGGSLYLDGGCSTKLGYAWAVKHSFEKIMVIRTQDRSFRKPPEVDPRLPSLFYRKYPALLKDLLLSNKRYNRLLDRIDRDEEERKCFVLAPSVPVKISRFEGDMEKLGELYFLGYRDMKQRIPELEQYLSR